LARLDESIAAFNLWNQGSENIANIHKPARAEQISAAIFLL
jgi:hypothetical protein